MTRDDALAALSRPSYDEETIAHDFEFIATKLGITTNELNKYFMELPKKTYKDYRSQRSLYNIGAKIMKTFGLEVGGKR